MAASQSSSMILLLSSSFLFLKLLILVHRMLMQLGFCSLCALSVLGGAGFSLLFSCSWKFLLFLLSPLLCSWPEGFRVWSVVGVRGFFVSVEGPVFSSLLLLVRVSLSGFYTSLGSW